MVLRPDDIPNKFDMVNRTCSVSTIQRRKHSPDKSTQAACTPVVRVYLSCNVSECFEEPPADLNDTLEG